MKHVLNKQVAGNYEYLLNKLKSLDPTQRWTVSIELFKSKRSIEQNSRLWALYSGIGKHLGYEADEVHELMGYKFLRQIKWVNNESIEVIKSTTKLNTQEMTSYMESIERWALQIGFIFED